jgi:hypothetical protein
VNINYEEYPVALNNRFGKALGREVNLNHEKVSDLVFELLSKVEQYQTEYKDTVMAVRKHLVEGQHGK